MANGKSFQEYLGVPQFNPSPTVSKLGGDGASLSAISNIGNMAIEAGAEYDKSNKLALLDEELTKLNQEALRTPEYYSQATQEVETDLATNVQMMRDFTKNPTFQTGEEVDQGYAKLQGVQLDLQNKLESLKRAKDQGTMSPKEYEIRAKDLTRSLVAESPYLKQELLGQLASNLNLTSMPQRLQYEQDIRQSSQERVDTEIKFQRGRLKELGLPESTYLDPMTGEFTAQSARLAQLAADSRLIQLNKTKIAREALDNKELTNKSTADQLVASGEVYDIANGEYSDLKLALAGLKTNFPSWKDYQPQAIEALGRASSQLRERYQGLASLNPEINAVLTQTLERFKNLEDTISKATSGEYLNKTLENEEKIADAQEKAGLRKAGINLEATRFINSMTDNALFAKLLSNGNADELIETFKVVGGVMNQGARLVRSNFDKVSTGGSVAQIVEQTATANVQKQQGQGRSVEVFNQVISDKLSAVEQFDDPKAQFLHSQDTIVNLSKPENAEAIKYLSPENKTKLEALISSQNAPLFKNLVESKASGVQFKIAPDGLLMTTNTSSDEASIKLRTGVVDRINDSLKGFAALRGIDTKAAAESFYNQFYKNTFDNAEIPKVDYMSQAKESMPKIAMRESGGKFYTPDGQYITSPKGAFGKYQLMVKTAMNPGYGIKPLDFSKSGVAFDKDQERFATEYYATMLKENNGDEKKALASYNWGIGNVKALESRFGADWFAKGQALPSKDPLKIPTETVLYVNSLSKDAKNNDKLITDSLSSYNLIEKNQPQVAATLWTSPSDKAKYIAEELNQSNPGLNITWEQVAQKLETTTSSPRKAPLTKEEMDKAFKTGESLFKKPTSKGTAQPVSDATKAYAKASEVAAKQRQQVYDAIEQGVAPATALVNAGLGILEGAVVDLATLPNKATWDMNHYKATGELRRKGTTQGMTPNLDKSLEQFRKGQ